MVKIQLKVTPSLAWLESEQNNAWVTLEKEVPEGTTFGDFISDLISKDTGFRKMLIDPETERISEQVELILNYNLLQLPSDANIKLKSGDTVTILPVYAGG